MAGEIPVLLQDMAVVLAVAAATTLLFNRLKQPTVLGYLLAGLVVGPYTPPFAFVREEETIRLLGDLGVIFLLFALGLEFNLRKLRKVGATALVSGTLQVALMIWLGYVVGRAFGLEPLGAIFLGAIVSISSTVIIVKVVGELRQQEQEWAQVVFGILIVEDILAVLMLTLLSAAGGADALTPASVGFLLGKFVLFITAALVVGLVVIPRLVTYVSNLRLEDVLVVTVIALGFGLAIVGGLLGFSPALGAFVMGALIAESPAHHRIEERVAPIRDLFTAIFFVTVGMLVDPRALVAHWPLILAVTAAVILGKIVAGTFATFVTGRTPTTSLRVGFGLAQVGEFSFILAALAASVGATDAPLYVVSVSAAAITAFTTPYLIGHAPHAARLLDRIAPRPLRTYVTLYSAWMARLYDRTDADPRRARATRAGVRTALYGAAAIAVIVGGGASVHLVGSLVSEQIQAEGFALAVGWLTVGLLALPLVFLYVRAQSEVARQLAQIALPHRVSARQDAATIEAILSRTFFLGGLVVAAALLLVFASPLLPTAPVALLLAVGLAIAGLLLYRALSRFQRSVDQALSAILGDDASDAGDRQRQREREREVLDVLRREDHPWPTSAREVEVPASDGLAAPLTIRRLHLRGRTGATIVGIRRGDEQFVNPSPDTALLPGDRLMLVGEDAQLEKAASLVAQPPPVAAASEHAAAAGSGGAPVVEDLRVAAGSLLAGRTLAALRLPDRVGVTVMEVRREGGERIPNPPPTTVLQEGDVVALLGTRAQHEKARALNSPSGAPPTSS